MLEKSDYRGIVLVASMLVAIAAIALFVGSVDLPAGVSLGRRGFTETAKSGDLALRPYSGLCIVISAMLAFLYRMKGLWK